MSVGSRFRGGYAHWAALEADLVEKWNLLLGRRFAFLQLHCPGFKFDRMYDPVWLRSQIHSPLAARSQHWHRNKRKCPEHGP